MTGIGGSFIDRFLFFAWDNLPPRVLFGRDVLMSTFEYSAVFRRPLAVNSPIAHSASFFIPARLCSYLLGSPSCASLNDNFAFSSSRQCRTMLPDAYSPHRTTSGCARGKRNNRPWAILSRYILIYWFSCRWCFFIVLFCPQLYLPPGIASTTGNEKTRCRERNKNTVVTQKPADPAPSFAHVARAKFETAIKWSSLTRSA